MSSVVRHGHYSPSKGRFGDRAFALFARAVWKAIGHRAPSCVDGVGVWEKADGEFVVRVAARDLFADPVRVLVRDLRGGEWVAP